MLCSHTIWIVLGRILYIIYIKIPIVYVLKLLFRIKLLILYTLYSSKNHILQLTFTVCCNKHLQNLMHGFVYNGMESAEFYFDDILQAKR